MRRPMRLGVHRDGGVGGQSAALHGDAQPVEGVGCALVAMRVFGGCTGFEVARRILRRRRPTGGQPRVERIELRAQVLHRRGALLGLLRKAAPNDLLKAWVDGQRRIYRSEGRHRLVAVLYQHADGVSCLKGRLASEALKHDHAERVDVGALIELLRPRLLRRHVARRAEDHAGLRQLLAAELGVLEFGDAEVEHLHKVCLAAGAVEEDVVGLEVPVHQPLTVRLGERRADLTHQADQAPRLDGPLDVECPLERDPIEKFHHHPEEFPLIAMVVDPDSVRMRQVASRLRLDLKSPHQRVVVHQLGHQRLDGDGMLGAKVPPAVDLAHATDADERINHILAVEHRADERIGRQLHSRLHRLTDGVQGARLCSKLLGLLRIAHAGSAQSVCSRAWLQDAYARYRSAGGVSNRPRSI